MSYAMITYWYMLTRISHNNSSYSYKYTTEKSINMWYTYYRYLISIIYKPKLTEQEHYDCWFVSSFALQNWNLYMTFSGNSDLTAEQLSYCIHEPETKCNKTVIHNCTVTTKSIDIVTVMVYVTGNHLSVC